MSLSLAKRVLEACRRQDLAPAGSRLAVAVSGGMDSVVLLDLLLEIRGALRVELVVATVDHGLRTGTSARDAAFVRRLAVERGLPCYTGRFDAPQGRGLEDAARRERMAFLRGVPAHRVALAHHQDDQAETVLLRLLRASSLVGLGGMAPVRDGLIRPLLEIPRLDLARWARRRGLRWREDASNGDLQRERNRLRQRVMPVLETVHGGLRERLAALAAEARELSLAPQELAALEVEPSLSRSAFRMLDAARARSVLYAWLIHRLGRHVHLGQEQLVQAARLAQAGSAGAWMPLSAGWRLAVCPQAVYCLPPLPQNVLLQQPGPRLWGVHRVQVERAADRAASVLLRSPLPGERFGGQPLREWLRRRGVPAPLRAYHPVFCRKQRVIWVPGGAPLSLLEAPGDLAITVTASIPSVRGPGHPWTATL